MTILTFDSDILVGIREITEFIIERGMYEPKQLDRARSQVTTWIARRHDQTGPTGRVSRKGNGFPEPLKQLKATGVYDLSEVAAWLDGNYGKYGAKS